MPLAAVAPILGWIWLGALVFFGDSVHRRCGFFADRGISPTAIWWTRLLYPLAILIPTTIVVPWSWAELGIGSMPNILAVGAASAVVCFAFGQLVGQWVRRPTLSFFAAPVYTAVSLAGIEFLYVLYDYLAFTIVLMAPVLFFASWRLTRRWLERRLDFGYHWRAMAYTALALALPCAAVFGHRWFTTPDARPAWRTEMAHTNVPGPNPDMPWLAMNVRSINPGLYTGDPREVHAYNEQFAELLQAELDDRNALAEHISGRDIFSFLDRINQVELGSANLSRRFRVRQGPSVPARQPPALQPQAGETRTYDREQAITMEADAIRILLKWSRQLRGRAARGQFPLSVLFEADAMEIRAVQQLEIAATRQTPETMRQLCELIPSDELRRKSRRVTLIKEWQGFQQMSWTTRTGVYVGKIFAGRGIPDSRPWLALERLRSARYVDELTHLVLNQLSGQLPLHFASPGAIHRRRLVEQAQGRAPSYSEAQRRYLERPPRPQMFDYWTADHEQRIDRLRRGYLTAGSGEPSE
jgi:hypothetical protein